MNHLQNHVGISGGAYSKPAKNQYLVEIFRKAEKADDIVEFLKQEQKREVRLTHILGYCVNPNFCLAEGVGYGTPPYRPSSEPEGFGSLEILNLYNQLYIMLNPDLKKFKKEEYLIKWLEEMWQPEAELLIAIKDQEVHTLYPKITEDVIVQALGWDKDKFEEIKRKAAQR